MRAIGLSAMLALPACAHGDAAEIKAASRQAGRAIDRGDARAVAKSIHPGARARVDYEAVLSKKQAEAWAEALADPEAVESRAVVLLAEDLPMTAVWTEGGWRFAEDPTDVYSQDTPRQALRALVRASRRERWDVLIRLAPERYRMGLAQEDLARAWTEGEHAEALQEGRDRLARHLAAPILVDSHQAVLDMGEGHIARLEREQDRWVVVEF